MAAGEIQSCGTPAFIKKKLAAGYHLHVLKDVKFDLQGLKSLIAKHVSAVTCENESCKEVSFLLGDGSGLGDLFEELDSRKADLGIISYDVSLSTIRDVSLTVSNISHTKKSPSTESATENAYSETEDVSRDSFPPVVQASLSNQVRALLLKYFHSCKRRWKFYLIQLAVPFILMLMCFFCIKGSMKNQYLPLKLDISSVYGATDGFYYNSDPTLSNLAETYKKVLESNDVNVKKVTEPTHHVLNYGKENLAKYLKRLVVGGAFDSIRSGFFNLTAWHNSGSRQSMPMSILLMQTALLRHITNTGSISLTFEPVISLKDKYNPVSSYYSGVWAGLFVPFALTFLSLTFIFVPAHETATRAKLLQLMSGTPAAVYWMATFLWDYLIYFIVCIFLIMVPAFFFPSVFFGMHSEAIGAFLVLLFLYGWASLPLGYVVSILLKRENRGLSIFISCCVLFSVVSIFLMESISFPMYRNNEKRMDAISRVSWIFRLFPLYSISQGAVINFRFAFSNAACDVFTPKDLIRCETASPSSSPALFRCCEDICSKTIDLDGQLNVCHTTMKHLSMKKYGLLMSNGPEALFLGLGGIIYFAILFFLETRTATKLLNIIKFHFLRMWNQILQTVLQRRHQTLRDENIENITEDPQVLLEEESVRNLTATQQGSGGKALVALGLTKTSGNSFTINRLTFGVDGEECFGILGVNGAGKTATFRILTGDDTPSKGNAFIKSYSLIGDCRKFWSLIGYCPEVDPLLLDLTGREALLLFGRLRGLNDQALQKNVNELIQSMGLTNYADELMQFYSGGEKRTLSVAIALVGSPPIIVLDEPTAGVGHESRRQIWKTLNQLRKRTSATILLATQSLEETEALCSRLAIMRNGRFRRLGSGEQLKSKDGQGLVLTIKLSRGHQNNAATMSALKAHVQNSLKNVTLTDEYQGILQYHMADPSMTVGHLFKFMSDVKIQFELEDYSIGTISLEQIFYDCSRA